MIVIGENTRDLVFAQLQSDRFGTILETVDAEQTSALVVDAFEEAVEARVEHFFGSQLASCPTQRANTSSTPAEQHNLGIDAAAELHDIVLVSRGFGRDVGQSIGADVGIETHRAHDFKQLIDAEFAMFLHVR